MFVSPTPEIVALTAGRPSADDLRAAEAHEWPSQLQPSIEVDEGGQDSSPSSCDVSEAPIHDNDGTSNTDQHAETRPQPKVLSQVNLLKRPTSSGQDLSAGFSFGKAKPVPKLNFDRKPTAKRASPPLQSVSPSDQLREESPSLRIRSKSKEAGVFTKLETAGLPTPQEAEARETPITVPFPHVNKQASSGTRTLEPHTVATTELFGDQLVMAAEHSFRFSGDDTLVEENPGTAQSEDLNELQRIQDASAGASLDAVMTPQNIDQRTASRISCVPQDSLPHTLSKVKKRKHMKPGFKARALHRNLTSVHYMDEGDVLELLLEKHRRNSQVHRQAQQEAEAEIIRLTSISNDVYAQWQIAHDQCNEQEKRLSDFETAKLQWKTKIKKLADTITDAHVSEKKSREDCWREIATVVEEKNLLVDTLREIQTKTEEEQKMSQQAITNSQHELKLAYQRIQDQQKDLSAKEALLKSGEERYFKLEGYMSKLSSSHVQLMDRLSCNHKEIVCQLNAFTKSLQPSRQDLITETQSLLASKLEQCTQMFQTLQAPNLLSTTALQELKGTMRGLSQMFTESLEEVQRSSSTSEGESHKLALSLQDQLNALKSLVFTETVLSEQITDLKEVRATLRERLHNTEEALKHARLDCAALQRSETSNHQKIAVLEKDLIIARQPVEDPIASFRLGQLESLNSNLQNEVTRLKVDLESRIAMAEEKDQEFERLHANMAEAQLQGEKARREAEVTKEEKSLAEQQAVQQLDDLRKELQSSLAKDIADLKLQHQIASQQLRKSLEEKSSGYARQTITANAEKGKVEAEAEKLRLSLKDKLKERAHETSFVDRLKARNAELENQVKANETLLSKAKEELADANADITAKDGFIKLMQDNQAERASEEGTNPKAKSQTTQKVAEPDPRPRPRCLPAVVEDSQLAERAATTPAGQVNDPFMGENCEPSQRLATQADLDGLSIGTPAPQEKEFTVSSHFPVSRGSLASPTVADPRKTSSIFSRHSVHRAQPMGLTKIGGRLILPTPDPAEAKGVKFAEQTVGKMQIPSRTSQVAPRSAIRDPRGAKRSAVASNVAADGAASAPKRRKPSLADLDPTVPYSQSPDRLLLGRGRKLPSKSKKTIKDREMMNRFSQEL